MPEKRPESRLCEICQKAEATVHICEVTCDVSVEAATTQHSRTVTHEYCAECAKTQRLNTGLEISDLTEVQSCYYCDNRPAGGGPNVGPALAVRKKPWHSTCLRCGRIERRFLIREMRKIPPHLPKKEAEAKLEDIYRQVDSYVREVLKSGEKEEPPPPIIGEMAVPEQISLSELAALLGKKPHEIMTDLMLLDVFATPDEQVAFDTVSKVLRGYGYIAKRAT